MQQNVLISAGCTKFVKKSWYLPGWASFTPSTDLPFRKKAQGQLSAWGQMAAFGFMLLFYLSVSENLIQFPFHGARLGKFQRIRLTDMVGGDAVTLCKAQNAADGNAVDDLGRGKPVDLLGKDFLS